MDDDYSTSKIIWRLPWYTTFMFFIYISIFYTVGYSNDSPGFNALVFKTESPRRVWTWYTYSLLHGSTLHLWINMLSWMIYGALLEYENSFWRTACISIISIIGGALASGWQFRAFHNQFNLLGVSGGIYGMLACQIANMAINFWDVPFLYRVFAISAICSTLITDIVIYSVMYESTTSYSAHIGGAIAGLLSGFVFIINMEDKKWEMFARYISLALLVLYSVAGSINLLI
jgi:membrane associated rhomboid family serine protease